VFTVGRRAGLPEWVRDELVQTYTNTYSILRLFILEIPKAASLHERKVAKKK
jgi:hypothetical protein